MIIPGNALEKADTVHEPSRNDGRKRKEFNIGQQAFARLSKPYTHRKLDLPITGQLNVTEKKGNAIKLTDKSGEPCIVHPDNILVGIELPKSDVDSINQQTEIQQVKIQITLNLTDK